MSADLKNGVLTLSVPKKPEVQPRKVTINTAGGGDKGAQPAKA